MIVAINLNIDGSTENLSYAPHSLRLFKDYFAHHEIEYHIITKPPTPIIEKNVHPSWTKLFPHRLLPGYDYIIVWDLDLLPRNRSVKVIKDFNMEKLSLAWDSNAKIHSIATEGKGYLYFPSFRYNTGLIGVPSSSQEFLDSVFIKYAPGILPSFEQYYFNEEVVQQNIEICELSDDLNMMYGKPGFSTARLQHYTGEPHTKSYVKSHVEKYFAEKN